MQMRREKWSWREKVFVCHRVCVGFNRRNGYIYAEWLNSQTHQRIATFVFFFFVNSVSLSVEMMLFFRTLAFFFFETFFCSSLLLASALEIVLFKCSMECAVCSRERKFICSHIHVTVCVSVWICRSLSPSSSSPSSSLDTQRCVYAHLAHYSYWFTLREYKLVDNYQPCVG